MKWLISLETDPIELVHESNRKTFASMSSVYVYVMCISCVHVLAEPQILPRLKTVAKADDNFSIRTE